MDEEDKEIINRILQKVLEISETIRNDMVTREEFNSFKSEMYTHLDGFIKLHNSLHLEVMALINKTNRIEEHLGL